MDNFDGRMYTIHKAKRNKTQKQEKLFVFRCASDWKSVC